MTILAIDFGGTQVKSALVSEEFAIEKSLPTQSSPQTLEQAIDVIDQLLRLKKNYQVLQLVFQGRLILRRVSFIMVAY